MAADTSPTDDEPLSALDCEACRATLRGGGADAVSFLLLDHLRIPLVGCDEHLARFAQTCGLTTENDADLLDHRPAGSIACPSCRLAPRRPGQSVVPIAGGGIAVVACDQHRDAVVERYRAGRDVRRRLLTGLDGRPTHRRGE